MIWILLTAIGLAVEGDLQDPARIEPKSGTVVESTRFHVDASGVQLQDRSPPESLAPEQLRRIVFRDPSHRRPQAPDAAAALVDGSQIQIADVTIEAGVAALRSAGGAPLKIDTRDISSLLLQTTLTPRMQQQWSHLAQGSESTEDLLVIRRDEDLDYLEGRVGDVTAEEVAFTLGDRTVRANRERIVGIVFYHAAGGDAELATCELITTGRSRLMVRQARYEEGRLAAELLCGARVELERAALVALDFSPGNEMLLSEATPVKVQWTPLIPDPGAGTYLQQLNQPRLNRGFDGQPLSLVQVTEGKFARHYGRRSFENGLAVKGGTRLVYSLEGKYARLTGWAGIAPDASREADVELIVSGDGRSLWRRVLKDPYQGAVNMDVPVAGVDRLTVTVDYHDGRNLGDIVYLCNLKVSK